MTQEELIHALDAVVWCNGIAEEVTLAYARYIFGYCSGWFFDRRQKDFLNHW